MVEGTEIVVEGKPPPNKGRPVENLQVTEDNRAECL